MYINTSADLLANGMQKEYMPLHVAFGPCVNTGRPIRLWLFVKFSARGSPS